MDSPSASGFALRATTQQVDQFAKVAEKRLFNFLLRGQKVKYTRPSGNSIACYFQSVTHKQLLAFEAD